MSKAPPPKGGVAGLALLFCVTAAGAGAAFDFTMRGPGGFWLGDVPGAAAVIGAGAALVCVIAMRAALFLFARKDDGGGDAGGHP